MDATELGPRLRAERTAGGRTIAAVAADAGLSVPYIANLENGRGNPTLSALSRLATALGLRLDVDLVADEPVEPPTEPTGATLRFARSSRFREAAIRIVHRTGVPEQAARQRLLGVLAAAQAVTGTELTTTDCHRFLDALVLATLDEDH
ncbi:MAG TPA: helix-turn-helix transcriptional regulator [Pseudonocardiaceae bacterium]|nr:helix-turn-helix transcriptional regulator [Pseudonocardiaceae bacterium]